MTLLRVRRYWIHDCYDRKYYRTPRTPPARPRRGSWTPCSWACCQTGTAVRHPENAPRAHARDGFGIPDVTVQATSHHPEQASCQGDALLRPRYHTARSGKLSWGRGLPAARRMMRSRPMVAAYRGDGAKSPQRERGWLVEVKEPQNRWDQSASDFWFNTGVAFCSMHTCSS